MTRTLRTCVLSMLIAVTTPARASAGDPGAATQPATRPVTRQPIWSPRHQARAEEILDGLHHWTPVNHTYGERAPWMQRAKDLLNLGPNAQRLAFEALPTLDQTQYDVLLDALSVHLKTHAIPDDARPAARAAIPRLIERFK